MGEASDDPRPPRPPMTPGQPLPRIVRFAPPPEEEPPPRKKKKDGKGKNQGKDGEKTGVLEEATPNLDTYETRRTIRLVVGVATLGILALVVFLFAGLFGGGAEPPAEENQAAPPPMPSPARTAARAEREAELALADARAFAKKGDGELSLRKLKGLVEGYPQTAAAEKARESLRNAEQGLPLFVDVPLVVARPGQAAPPAPEPADEAVVIAAPEPPPPGPAEAAIAPPPIPPEPFRETGLPIEPMSLSPRPLPAGFRARAEAGLHPSGWPWEITCDKDGAAMRLVPGGTFLMGREAGPAEERPAHRVAISTFYMDQHETTVRQYGYFIRETGRKSPSSVSEASSEDQPVTRIRAQEAYEYTQWAGKELPTEAQWEFAARTIDGRLHPWGPDDPVWEPTRRPGQIDPVMSFPLDMSPYGVFDLAGNVREWTLDWFDPKLYRSQADQVARDPANPTRPRSRSPEVAIRGGSPAWLSTWRAGMKPDARLPDLGFRGVLAVERSANPTIPASGPAPAGGRPSGGLVPF